MKNKNYFQKKLMLSLFALTLTGATTFTAHAQNVFPATGNVGIGNTTPAYRLQIASPDIRAMQIDGSNTAWTGMYINSTNTTGQPFYGYISNNGTKYAYSYLTPAGDFKLYVSGDRLSLLGSNGYLGLGTTTPTSHFHVVANVSNVAKFKRSATGTDLTALIDIENGGGTMWRYGVGGTGNGLGITGGQFYIERSGIGSALTIATNGNVGIGTNNPLAKLTVNGLVCAKEVRVSLSGAPCWPDFVFAKDYKLKDLSEVESFIKLNQHLPGIPSAAEVEEGGVELGEINMKLLQKIEELTLYMISIKKENEALKTRLDVLESK